MGLTNLYQIYDTCAECAAGPIMSQKKEAPALRDFHAVLGMDNTMPGRYPEQFELRYLGFQDETTGHIDACLPQIVATGRAWAALRRDEADNDLRAERARNANGDNQGLRLDPNERRNQRTQSSQEGISDSNAGRYVTETIPQRQEAIRPAPIHTLPDAQSSVPFGIKD